MNVSSTLQHLPLSLTADSRVHTMAPGHGILAHLLHLICGLHSRHSTSLLLVFDHLTSYNSRAHALGLISSRCHFGSSSPLHSFLLKSQLIREMFRDHCVKQHTSPPHTTSAQSLSKFLMTLLLKKKSWHVWVISIIHIHAMFYYFPYLNFSLNVSSMKVVHFACLVSKPMARRVVNRRHITNSAEWIRFPQSDVIIIFTCFCFIIGWPVLLLQ
jgi:hypothetical protein